MDANMDIFLAASRIKLRLAHVASFDVEIFQHRFLGFFVNFHDRSYSAFEIAGDDFDAIAYFQTFTIRVPPVLS